jgi:hypothetical protein
VGLGASAFAYHPWDGRFFLMRDGREVARHTFALRCVLRRA